jgi:hypothetical protein
MAWIHLSTAAQNAAAAAVSALIDTGSASSAGSILIYNGTAPATVNDATSGQTLLATLTFSNPAFGSSALGVVTAGTITADTSASASGVATWARITDRDGVAVMDVDVGTASATLILDDVNIVVDEPVSLTSGELTMPSGT